MADASDTERQDKKSLRTTAKFFHSCDKQNVPRKTTQDIVNLDFELKNPDRCKLISILQANEFKIISVMLIYVLLIVPLQLVKVVNQSYVNTTSEFYFLKLSNDT